MKAIKKIVLVVVALATLGISNLAGADAYQGYQLFQTYCMVCHGADGMGKGPLASKLNTLGGSTPSNLNKTKKSARELFRIIQGTETHADLKIGGTMPQWGMAISAPQIRSLVSYIELLRSKDFPIIGQPDKGKATYKMYCVVCHGDTGKGDGPLAMVMKVRAEDHTSSGMVSKLSNQRLIDIVNNGGSGLMPAWRDVLSRDEVESLVGYLRLLSN